MSSFFKDSCSKVQVPSSTLKTSVFQFYYRFFLKTIILCQLRLLIFTFGQGFSKQVARRTTVRFLWVSNVEPPTCGGLDSESGLRPWTWQYSSLRSIIYSQPCKHFTKIKWFIQQLLKTLIWSMIASERLNRTWLERLNMRFQG